MRRGLTLLASAGVLMAGAAVGAAGAQESVAAPTPPASVFVQKLSNGVLTTNAPVFILPDATRTPLTVLTAGTSVIVLRREGDWYRAEFHDSNFGDRTGYVAVSSVQLSVPDGGSRQAGSSPAAAASPVSAASADVANTGVVPGPATVPAAAADDAQAPGPLSPAGSPPPMAMDMDMPGSGWSVMQDAVVFGMFNHQGGKRGGNEFKVPNWWMGMFSRKTGSSQLTINTMVSLDAATVDDIGYREIFQLGETFRGRPLIDRQHPHDFFMQFAGVWRIPVSARTGFTLAGGPAGEPALGPVAFMHRASAAENPMAPLSHHTFDSTHIAFGVVTAAVDHGPWVVEASMFNGREPDEHRWDFDFGRLDSVSGRVWYRPRADWEFQFSTARLADPEELEPGALVRSTASGSWLKTNGNDFSAVTAAYGINVTEEASRHAIFVEATRHWGRNSLFTRAELVDVETSLLLDLPIPLIHDGTRKDTVGALTFGGVRDLVGWRGFAGGIGAAVTFYDEPVALTATHGSRPTSFQIYFRLRPPASSMGRMWNMRMSQPMRMTAEAPAHQHVH